ncbi:hypothetical protein [Thermaerobacillus caldiproteolyticus]|uniref:hypothetical protein n=1 Tax=Thermaerobacillus caldiproteolyticus TaxID=247480 RepID=UPI00188C8E88|nr:hypothetical protein [Anoxybacillus caldiproteolyticus]QPA33416.1 hypothetical protein ISX45_19025 [Anoxybacillus caldiproteolyticus]
MYFVIYRTIPFAGFNISKAATIDEAKEIVSELFEKGIREVYLSQEIPMNIKVSIEI